jgi:predicted lipoprotein
MSSTLASRISHRASLLPFALATLVCGLAATVPGGMACSVREVSTTPNAEEEVDVAVRNHVAHEVAVPTFNALAAEAVLFEQAMASLESEPSAATLGAAQDGWRKLRVAWKRSRVLGFGPAKTIETRVDWPSNDPERVEEAIATKAFDAASIQKLGTSQRGFLGLEYLLFDPAGGNVAVLDAFVASTDRRAFARALAADLVAAFQELAAAWDPARGDYAGELAEAGEGSTAYPEAKNAIDALVNESIFVVEYVLGDELAKPFGLRNDGVAQPDLVIAARSDASLDDSIAQLESFQAVYTGALPGGDATQATGLSALVEARGSAQLDADVRSATQRSLDALRAVPRPFATAITASPAEVQRAYDEVRVLKNLLAADVATKLGATLSFNDNDGD